MPDYALSMRLVICTTRASHDEALNPKRTQRESDVCIYYSSIYSYLT